MAYGELVRVIPPTPLAPRSYRYLLSFLGLADYAGLLYTRSSASLLELPITLSLLLAILVYRIP